MLLAAARQGSVEGATRVLDDGANPDASTPDGPDKYATAIAFAVRPICCHPPLPTCG